MYTLDHINRIQTDVNNLNKYSLEIARELAVIRNTKIPIDSSDVFIDDTNVEVRWSVDCGRGCCSDSYYIDYPTLYLSVPLEQLLESERIKLKQQEETKRLEELAKKEIKDKITRESELLQLRKLKEKYENPSVELSPEGM